jgi:HK97 gp10 family phage protein
VGVKIKGVNKLISQLEEKYGEQNARRISDKALKAGAEVFVRELKQELETFRDKGGTVEELTIGDPEDIGGVRVVKVHWKGPRGRYRIIHLNEWGTVKNPNPRGKGAIARALKNSEKAYRAAIKRAVQEGI